MSNGGTAFFCLLISAVCLLDSGCIRREPPADVTIINNAEPESLDPAIITGQPELRIVIGLFEGLTRLDPKTARPIPGLAESWEISPDGCTYTFHLRTNLVWSTGEPITADDVVYSWMRALEPGDGVRLCRGNFLFEKRRGFNHRQNQRPVAGGRSRAGQIHRARGIEPSHGLFSRYLRPAGDERGAAPDD